MSHPLVWLTVHGYRNRIRRWLRSLARPRTVVTVGLALAYVSLLLRQQHGTVPSVGEPALVTVLLGLLFAAGTVWAWIGPEMPSPLRFSAAEASILLSAPLARRTVLLYKLARWQAPLLFNALVLTLLLSTGQQLGSALRRMLAVWLLLATLRTHRLAASLVRERLRVRGSPLALVAAGVLAVAFAIVLAATLRSLPPGTADDPSARLAGALRGLEASRALAVLFAPWMALAAPIAWSRDAAAWAARLAAPAGLLAVHLWWVLRADLSLEEAAAQALGGLSPAQRQRREPVVVGLRPAGWPALALTWRQLARLLRRGAVRRSAAWAAALALGALGVTWLDVPALTEFVLILAMLAAGATALTGPLWVRMGLRREYGRFDRLRPLPLTGTDVLLALGLASWSATLALQLGTAALLALLLAVHPALDPAVAALPALLPPAVALLPATTAAGVLVCEAAAVWFPEWVGPPVRRGGGLDALGSSLLGMLAYLLGTALLLAPAAAAALGMAAVAHALHVPPTPPGIVVTWLVVLLEVTLLAPVLGRAFDRAEYAPEARATE